MVSQEFLSTRSLSSEPFIAPWLLLWAFSSFPASCDADPALGLDLREAADPSWTTLFSPFPTEASFLREDCPPATQSGAPVPWCQVLCCQYSLLLVPVPASLHQSLGSSRLLWETEKVLNNGGLRINPCWRPPEHPAERQCRVAARPGELRSAWISSAVTPCVRSQQLELPKALRKPLTSAPSPV